MFVVFDIGGTKMRLAASHDHETIGELIVIPTPRSFDEAVERFREVTHTFSQEGHIEAMAGGIRGVLNREKSTLISEIYLNDWVSRPIKDTLSSACAAPVYLENDTALVGLGEAVVGAGKGEWIVAYITVSTGIGGVRIVEQKLDETVFGFEPGKQIIDPDKTLCPDCPGSTLEEYVSGGHVEERFGKPAYKIQDQKVWRELSSFFAVGLHNTIVHWSPNVVVLGGPMIVGDPSIIFEEVEKRVRETLIVFPDPPRIVKADLGDVGGLHGALVYLKQQLQES